MTHDHPSWLESVLRGGAERCLHWADPDSGLQAVVVIDDLSLGPAAGGIRTWPYADINAAAADAAALARAMTLKCSIAGLDAGGCKIAVLDHAGLDRPRAFEVLGRHVEELAGTVRTAGDLGTTRADLEAAARRSRYVHLDEGGLSASAARGVVACMEACARHRGVELAGLRVAVQGCGSMGSAVARALAGRGVLLTLSDREQQRAARLAEELDAIVAAADHVLTADVDLLAPCATGGVITEAVAASMRAWAVVGAANNVLDSPAAGARLAARQVLFVPDFISSAGAVVRGVGESVMGLADTSALVDALGTIASEVLRQAEAERNTPTEVAVARARKRIERRRGD